MPDPNSIPASAQKATITDWFRDAEPGHGMPPVQPRPEERAAMMAREQEELRRKLEREKIRAARPIDLNMPDDVAEVIVGDGVAEYNKLREVERKLDSIMTKKRLDLLDPLQNPVKSYTTLKIWISNTVENQPWQGRDLDENAFDFNMGVEATYRVKLEGRVIEDEDADRIDKDSDDGKEYNMAEVSDAMDTDAPQEIPNPETPPQKRAKLSHFFKQITFDFDRNKNVQPDGMTQVEWKKQPGPQNVEFDCLEFERKSDENINIAVNLYRDEREERLKLSKPLANLLDTEEETKANVIMMIWEYVKTMGLQQDEEKRTITCDDSLKAVFKAEQIRFPDLHRLLDLQLFPLDPLRLPYTIRCDPDYHQEPTVYVLTLLSPFIPGLHYPHQRTHGPPDYAIPVLRTLADVPLLLDIQDLDNHNALLIEAINNSKRKQEFFNSLAKDPVAFTKRWIGSQRRDEELVLGEGGRFEGEWASNGPERVFDKEKNEWVDAGSRGALRGQARKGGKEGIWGTKQVEEAVRAIAAKGGGF